MDSNLFEVLTAPEILRHLPKEKLKCIGDVLEPQLSEEQKKALIEKLKSNDKDMLENFGLNVPDRLMVSVAKMFYQRVNEKYPDPIIEAILKCL